MVRSENVPIPTVTLGRTGIVGTSLALGTAGWPLRVSHHDVVDVVDSAITAGLRYLDLAPLYRTEASIGRVLEELGAGGTVTLATKVCSYQDDLGIIYREYSSSTVYGSVHRSLEKLRVDHIPIVHIHDCQPEDLPVIFGPSGALEALLDLKGQGIIGSVGMATESSECLLAAVACGDIDHIQSYHTCTLLNQEGIETVFRAARAKGLSIINCAPFAGWILATGPVPGALYNYKPAKPTVVEAVKRLEAICADKGVTLAAAALAFSLFEPSVDMTVVGASSSAHIAEHVGAFDSPLKEADFAEMVQVAGGPFPIVKPYADNPVNVRP